LIRRLTRRCGSMGGDEGVIRRSLASNFVIPEDA
jgi:hypothetical protein